MNILQFATYVVVCATIVFLIGFVTCSGCVLLGASVLDEFRSLNSAPMAGLYMLSGVVVWLYLSFRAIRALNRWRRGKTPPQSPTTGTTPPSA